MFKNKSLNARQALTNALQRNAIVAAKIATSFVSSEGSSFLHPLASSQTASTTYSICSIGNKKTEGSSDTFRIVELMKNYESGTPHSTNITATIDDGRNDARF